MASVQKSNRNSLESGALGASAKRTYKFKDLKNSNVARRNVINLFKKAAINDVLLMSYSDVL